MNKNFISFIASVINGNIQIDNLKDSIDAYIHFENSLFNFLNFINDKEHIEFNADNKICIKINVIWHDRDLISISYIDKIYWKIITLKEINL